MKKRIKKPIILSPEFILFRFSLLIKQKYKYILSVVSALVKITPFIIFFRTFVVRIVYQPKREL